MEVGPRARAELPGVPGAVRALLDVLADSGHAAWLVGGCVRDLIAGGAAGEYDVCTEAPPETVLALFPNAVPIGLRHGTVMIPTRDGPVDVTTLRAGPRLEDDLAHRDFTVNAMAWDPRRGELIDPFDGRSDLAKGRLRAVGAAADRFAEDPLRALRAARLAATRGFEVDPETVRAMGPAAVGLEAVPRERVRRELELLLLSPDPAEGLTLLRSAGLERALVGATREDAPAVVERLPARLELRLAGWLRGARVLSVLRRLRFPRRTAERVDRLLRLHPVEQGVRSLRPPDVRRLLKRAGEENLRSLLALREAELAAGSEADPEAVRAQLRALGEAIERIRRAGSLALHRGDLALDGAAVMAILDSGPGPLVGRALAYLTEQVIEDPSRNQPDTLRALLRAWRDQASP